MTGMVVTAFERRSFSFILADSTGEEIFAHVSDYPNNILFPVGSRVEFAIGSFREEKKAVAIKLIALPASKIAKLGAQR
jgi:cold shock CspA family protein